MMCEPDQIGEIWTRAQKNPIDPVLVDSAPCQEEVHIGKELANDGLDEMPVPVNTPGFSGVMRTTASHVVTKDIETGIQNCGCYGGKLLDRNLIGLDIGPTHHGSIHWLKCKEKGVPMDVAIVVGAPPNVAYTSVTSIPYGTDEFAVASGIACEPLEVVRCRTVDLVVPAHAEIVIEGTVSTVEKVQSAAYGEYTGYMYSADGTDYLMTVTCITHRRSPIYTVFLSQMPPSESTKVSQIGCEVTYFKHLRYDCNIPGVLEVAFPELAGGSNMCVVRMKKSNPSDVWQVLSAANAFSPDRAKIIIAVDEDIDPNDLEAVNWAMTWRMQPHRDLHIMRGRTGGLDYSSYRPQDPPEQRRYPEGLGASSLLIDATLKWQYPPTSLPKQEYMENAIKLWNELKLGPLNLKSPWFGYNLGYWHEKNEENAKLIMKGDYKAVGRKLKKVDA
jgi:4-hydroxy-3-polyprenylbenzoate decarboxylase